MKITFRLLGLIVLLNCLALSYSQKYSSTSIVFYLYGDNKLVETVHSTPGLVPLFGHNNGIDPKSKFKICTMYTDEDAQYLEARKFNLPGAWSISSLNVRRYRPIRFFKIEKKISEDEVEVMCVFLNYDYNSCNKMPCVDINSYDIVDIKFSSGNFMLLDKPNLADWENGSEAIVKIEGAIINYLLKNQIKVWDSNRFK